MSSNYHTKPFLFGGEDLKPLGILDKFDEDKKKAKQKNESDMLAKESLHFQETLNTMQQSILSTEKNLTVCKTILEGFDHLAVTLQQNQASLRDGITQQFESLLTEAISQKQTLTNMEGKLLETGVATTELGSYVHDLDKSLEALRQEHVRGKKQLEEAMHLLSTLASNHSTRTSCGGVADSAVQTSPGLVQPDSQPDGTRPPCCQPECTQRSDVSSRHPGGSSVAKNSKPSQRRKRRTRRRPLLIPRRRKKSAIWDENSQPLMEGIKKEDVPSPLKEICNAAVIHPNGDRRSPQVSPFSPWFQDSHVSVCVEPIEAAEPKREARGLWQLFDINCDSDSIIVQE